MNAKKPSKPACDRPAFEKSKDSLGPERVRARPDPGQWGDDELMSLGEAAALFWPDGPLTTTSLRTAVRDRRLDVAEIAGKILTNKLAIGRMCVCGPRGEPNSSTPPQHEPLQPAALKPPTDREIIRRMLKAD
jgi:hypothetical protein